MTLPRVPLPGQQPVYVYGKGQRPKSPGRRRVPFSFWLALVALVVLLVGWFLWQITATEVTVIANGRPQAVHTHALKVIGALRSAGIDPEKAAYVSPDPQTPLSRGMVIVAAYPRPVIVLADGTMHRVDIASTDPLQIVQAAGIALGPQDAVTVERSLGPDQQDITAHPALANVPRIPRQISVLRARTIIVNESGQAVSFVTTAQTVIEALSGAGYTLYSGDVITPSLESPLPPGDVTVTIQRAIPITLTDNGQSRGVRTQAPTVSDLLAQQGLALTGTDYITPPLEARIPPGGEVRIVRVREIITTEETPIPFETVYMPDPDMELDQHREAQAGSEGTLARRILIRLEDGKEVSRVVVGEYASRLPQARVVAYGTKIVIREVRTEFGFLKFWRKLHVLATSYSPLTAGDKKPGDARFGLSGTGAPVTRGVVAVDIRVISLGTRLYVPNYGPGMALDVGGAVKGLRIDLGYEDPIPVLWNDWTDLYLLLPIPPPDEIRWVIPLGEQPETP